MQKIPKSTFSTAGIDPNKRYEAFRESMGVVFNVSKPANTCSDFSATIESYLLGEVLLVECMTNGQRFERSKQMIAQDGMSHYLVQFFNYGHTRQTSGKGEAIGGGENLLIIDTSQPWEAMNSDFHNTTLVVPRRLMSNLLIHEDDHHGRIINSQNPFGHLLLNYFIGLRQSLDKMSIQDAHEASKLGMNLLSSALNRASSGNVSSQISPQFFKNSIKQYLEKNISNPDLTVDLIAERFRISRSHLYRLFDSESGLANYIRGRRMNIALKKLMAQLPQKESVSEIAASVGYKNPSAFTRAFKQHFDISPIEAREDIDQHNFSTQDVRMWEHWLLTL